MWCLYVCVTAAARLTYLLSLPPAAAVYDALVALAAQLSAAPPDDAKPLTPRDKTGSGQTRDPHTGRGMYGSYGKQTHNTHICHEDHTEHSAHRLTAAHSTQSAQYPFYTIHKSHRVRRSRLTEFKSGRCAIVRLSQHSRITALRDHIHGSKADITTHRVHVISAYHSTQMWHSIIRHT